MLQIPVEQFSTTGLLVFLVVMVAGLLFIYFDSRRETKRLKKEHEKKYRAVTPVKYNKEVDWLLGLDDQSVSN